jgi:transcriptional regulator with XRE-family HTH domain
MGEIRYSVEPANFADYRDFLSHRFETLRNEKSKKSFSLQACARRSKISKSHLQFLFQKKRHLSLDKFPALAKTLQLTNDEEYFVYLLICKNSSQNPYVRAHFEKILARLRHEKVITSTEAPSASSSSYKLLYQDALATILHNLVRLKGFQEDPQWIVNNVLFPGLTPERILSALNALEESGALVRNENGRLSPSEFPFWRPDPLDPHGQDVYRKGAEAVAHLLKTPEAYKPAVYMLMSLALDEERLAAAERIMIELHHQLRLLAEQSESPTANVYIGNFLMTVARLKKS